MIELYIADLVTGDYPEKIVSLRMDAFKTLKGQLKIFRDRLYDDKLIEDIETKRAEFIMQTDSKTEMEKVLHPDYNNSPKYGIDAEEIIFWAECSLKYPLPDKAYNRYMELVKEYYGEQPWMK